MNLTAEDRARYNTTKAKNNALIEKFCKKHKEIDETDLKKNIKYCLYENIKPDYVCNKRPLGNKKILYHYHYKRLCVIEYNIIYIGKCYIPDIVRISTEEKAHKRYNRDVKSIKRR